MIEIELGENDTALVQGATRAVSFSPRSISTKYSSAKSQKPLGCASRFLRLPRGILLKTLSTISKTSRLRLEVFEIVSRVLSPYTSRFKNYIVRFHIKIPTYLKTFRVVSHIVVTDSKWNRRFYLARLQACAEGSCGRCEGRKSSCSSCTS